MDFQAVFADVSAKTGDATAILEDHTDLIVAHETLAKSLVADAAAKIRDACDRNFREAELLRFSGGDLYESYSLLSLVVGPRDRGQKHHYKMMGVEPVVMILRRVMFPFCVYHVWDPYTNTNSLRACW